MASPQLEHGYLKIATELWEALIRIRVPGEARQVFDAIIRMTYGWNKKEAKITLGNLSNMTGLIRQHVFRAIKKLESMNMIRVTKKGYSSIISYSVNKHYKTWIVSPKKVTVTKKGYKVSPKKVTPVTKKGYTHISKDTIKDNIPPHKPEANSEPNKKPKKRGHPTWLTPYFDLWKELLGGTMVGGEAANYLRPLHEEYGQEKVLRYLKNYIENNNAQFIKLATFSQTFGRWSGKYQKAEINPNAGGTERVVL